MNKKLTEKCQIMGHYVNPAEIENPHIARALKKRLSYLFLYGEKYEQAKSDDEEGWRTLKGRDRFGRKETTMRYQEGGETLSPDEKRAKDYAEQYDTGWYP